MGISQPMGEAYDALMERMRELDVMGQIGGLLGWDQEVMMPPKAAALRAEQLAWLSKEGHKRMTDPKVGELLSTAEAEVGDDEIEQGNLRIIRDSYDKATKKPVEFVEEKARHTSKSIVSWTEAREKNDFSIFRDDLAKMIDMSGSWQVTLAMTKTLTMLFLICTNLDYQLLN